jgi:SRP72 RNA-binding domain
VKVKKRKRKPKYPKGFNPANPGPPPDPERWLPKRERSTYRPKRKDKRAQIRGAQGAVSRDKHDTSAAPGQGAGTSVAAPSKAGQAGVGSSKGGSSKGGSQNAAVGNAEQNKGSGKSRKKELGDPFYFYFVSLKGKLFLQMLCRRFVITVCGLLLLELVLFGNLVRFFLLKEPVHFCKGYTIVD